jgi:hypothetical protein
MGKESIKPGRASRFITQHRRMLNPEGEIVGQAPEIEMTKSKGPEVGAAEISVDPAKIEEIRKKHGETVERTIEDVLAKRKKQMEWALELRSDPERQKLIAGKKIDPSGLLEEIHEALSRMDGMREACEEAVLARIAREELEGRGVGNYRNLINSAASGYFFGEQQGELGKFLASCDELLKIEKRRKKIGPEVAGAGSEPKEKRREQIKEIVAAEFDDFAKNDLDIKLQRVFTGKSATPEEITEVRERFFQEKGNIISEITQLSADEIEKGARDFADKDALKSRVHIRIWGKMLDFARWEKGDLFGPTVNPMDGTEDTKPERAIAMHTIDKIDNYDQLKPDFDSGKTKAELDKEGNEKIKKLARELIKEFTVHGTIKNNVLQPYSDLDGRTCLFLFRKAGFTVKDVEYVEQGQSTKKGKGIVVDTAKKHGYVIEELGMILIIDHHDPEKSGRDSSATKFVFEGLRDFGLFDELDEKEKIALECYERFVTKEDNKDFTDEETVKIYKNFTHNLAGLKRYLSDSELYKVFRLQTQSKGDNFDPYDALPEDFLKNELSYRDGGEVIKYIDEKKKPSVKKKLEKSVRASERGIRELKAEGFIIHTGGGQHGDVLIDIGRDTEEGPKNRVGMGYDAARAKGFGAYIEWSPQTGYFAIKTANPIKFSLYQGNNQRGHYWLKADGEEPLVPFRQVLAELMGDLNYQIDQKLEAALRKNREDRETARKKERAEFKPTASQEWWLAPLIQEAQRCKKDFIKLNANKEFSEWDIADHVEARTRRLYKKYLSGKYDFSDDKKSCEAVTAYILEEAEKESQKD